MLPLRVRIGLVAVALLSLIACTTSNWKIVPPANTVSRDDEIAAADGLNAFAADLYAQLRAKDGNLIVSPYSVSTSLAMTATGARGNTRAEMEKVLHLPPGAKLGAAYRATTDGLIASRWSGIGKLTTKQSELHVAYSLWLQSGDAWKKDFLATAQDDFGATLSGADFVRDSEGGRKRINKWAEDLTQSRIKDLVPEGALDANTRLVLANAIYFKAQWATQFKKEDTREEDFTLASGQKVRVPLMQQKADFLLRERDGVRVLRLPYAGGALSMYVLLPTSSDGLPALEQGLTAETLAEWTRPPGKEQVEGVRVWLPKFKFTLPTELANVLHQMGMRDAFDPARANFAGMTERSDGLHITRVIHKAFIETDEVGTEAAAATAVVVGLRSMPSEKVFRADRPCLFVIKHEQTGAVLFMGRVANPS